MRTVAWVLGLVVAAAAMTCGCHGAVKIKASLDVDVTWTVSETVLEGAD